MAKRRRIRLAPAAKPASGAQTGGDQPLETRPAVPGHVTLPPGDSGLPQPVGPVRLRIVLKDDS